MIRTARLVTAGAALAVISVPAAAQQVVQRTNLTLEGARQVVAAVVAEAQKRKTTGAIAVVDAGGAVVALERLDNTFPMGSQISIGKARTASQFQRPTKVFEDLIRNGRTPMIALEDFTPLVGGVPILVGGQVVGAVGVSGAASAAEDEELALIGARALDGKVTAGVTVFDRATVEKSFAAGGELIDGKAGRSYMVHTSRRDKDGIAEIHTHDTDIFYVLSGTATLVTGGKVVGSRETGPGELRGDTIEGGETRTISKGDVVVIPAGMPHWFREVKGPVTYYTVKAR
ncbi:MAG: heme-binding protein [Gemmatimonadales bacterium]